VLLLAACDRVSWLDGPEPVDSSCANAPTWQNEIDPLLRTWCTTCHHSLLNGEERLGAPAGIDFDTLAGARSWSDRIRASAAMSPITMPPAGGLSADERRALQEWVDCDTPGTEAVAEVSCADAVLVAPDGVGSCASPVIVDGDWSSLTPSSCVCEVRGDLEIVGAGRLGMLTRVDGAIRTRNATYVSAPRLRYAGEVQLVDSPLLDLVELGELGEVGGELHIAGATRIATLDLAQLSEVGGALRLESLASLTSVDFARLERVGGDMQLIELPLLARIHGLETLATVGGDLSLIWLPQLEDWWAPPQLTTLGGSIELRDLGSLRSLRGFDALYHLPGDLIVERCGALSSVQGLEQLEELGGTVRVVDNPVLAELDCLGAVHTAGGLEVRHNPRLQTLRVLGALDRVHGDLELVELESLGEVRLGPMQSIGGSVRFEHVSALPGLRAQEIGGRLSLVDLPMAALPAFEHLTSTGGLLLEEARDLVDLSGLSGLSLCQGDLEIRGNDSLVDLSALHTLSWVDGDVRITDNPGVSEDEAEALLRAIDRIEGTIVVQ